MFNTTTYQNRGGRVQSERFTVVITHYKRYGRAVLRGGLSGKSQQPCLEAG